jgi:type II secretory ATPase GspE/PulE/Tfp pilus assembly ATPase PilB-like protein
MDSAKIKELLLQENYVSADDMKRAEAISVGRSDDAVISYLLREKLITKQLLGQAIAEADKVPFVDLEKHMPSSEALEKLSAAIAVPNRAILFSEDDQNVTIATDDPGRSGLLELLAPNFPDKKITIAYALTEDIDVALAGYRKPLATRFSEILKASKKFAPEIIDQILADADLYHASDIHFEPQQKDAVVRFRVDGVLHEAGRIPREYYENILNRIKVQAHLRIDEHFAAQDGAFHYTSADGGTNSDFRVSIIPIADGEKIALRALSAYVRDLALADIGVSAEHEKVFLDATRQPFNLILVTGPTGSGKTTLLYSLVKILNRPEVNITTIEDPVEYKIPGVNQIQVNAETNLTFASGLRSIVRQDPDVILVGEIRDNETGEIAVNAALTGHLVLSTFHATDAATAIPRLLDMNIEPFLLASTIVIVSAQRLIRMICPSCRFSHESSLSEVGALLPDPKRYFDEGKFILYRGKGCNVCGGTGFRGRTGIHEIIRMTKEMRELILKHPSADQIWNLAQSQGSRSLFEDGIEKVKAGVTTLEELLRVAPPTR